MTLNLGAPGADHRRVSTLTPSGEDGAAGIDIPTAVDDLLPNSSPFAAVNGRPGPATPDDGPATPVAPRTDLSVADLDEVERLHAEVQEASDACERSPFGGRGRRTLRSALMAEDEKLRELGFGSYAAFVHATRFEGTPPPRDGDFGWAMRGAGLAGPTPPEPEAPASPAHHEVEEPLPTPAPAPPLVEAPELDQVLVAARTETAGVRAELESARTALDSVRSELAVAHDRNATGEAECGQIRQELEQQVALREQAKAEADEARRQLEAIEHSLEQLRRDASEQVTQVRAQADAVAQQSVQQLQDLAQQVTTAEARAAAAEKSRDTAVDEIARLRGQLDEQRMQRESAATLTAAVESAREELEGSQREVAALRDRLTQEEDRRAKMQGELQDARARLQQRDAAFADARGEADAARAALEQAQAELEAARGEIEAGAAELADLHAALEAAADHGADAAPELPAANDAPGSEATAGPTEPAPADDADDVRSLVRQVRDLGARSTVDPDAPPAGTGASADVPALRAEAARLEDAVDRLREKRRRVKRRLAADRERVLDEQAALRRELDALSAEVQRRRDLVADAAQEHRRVVAATEATVAQLAGDAATRLERAALDEEMIRRALRVELERAGRDLAALEADVEMIAVEAGTLQSRLASRRSRFGGHGPDPDPDD